MKKLLLVIVALLSVVFSEANDSWHNEDRYNTCVCDAPRYWNLTRDIDENLHQGRVVYGNSYEPIPPPPLPEDSHEYRCFPDRSKWYQGFIYKNYEFIVKYGYFSPTYYRLNYQHINKLYRCEYCNEPDIPFSENDKNATYSDQWRIDSLEAEEKRQTCSENNGTIETAKLTCVDYERCKIKNIPECTEEDTDFPEADNLAPLFKWIETDNRSQQCSDINNTVELTRIVNCKTEYLCALVTEEPPKEEPQCISSYVSPRDSTFHEDIAITGAELGLHYSSGNVDENQSKTVAYGWSLSNHATLMGNRLYLGSGELLVVEPSQGEDLTVVKIGSSELLFDSNGKHIQTRDLYTKEVEMTFTYDSEENLIGITNKYDEVTTINRDSNGLITSITAPYGQTTYLSINENRDLLEVQYEDTSSYTFEYEKHLMTLEREPNGNEFLHFFDKLGNVVKVIDAEQGEWDFGVTSDTTSGTHTVQKASGDTITYKKHFLENGVLKTEKTLPTGDVILYENAVDDSRSSTTTCGQTNTNIYKLENGILAKDPLQGRRILQSSRQTTPSGLSKVTNYTTNYIFDENNTLVSIENITETNGATTASLRDYSNSTLTQTSAEGIINKSTFDPVTQNLLTAQYANLEPTTFTYDDKGRVTQSTQGDRITTTTYDERGNVARITDPKGQTTTYSYDLLDRVTQMTFSDGHSIQYIYDANGNMTTLTTPTPTDHTFAYNGVNKRTNYTSPLQSTTTYTYDKQRRVINVTKPSGAAIDTTYTDGRVTAVTTPEGTTNYNYACQSKVSSITKEDESLNFTYDGDLLTSMTQAGVLNKTIDYSYNNNFIPSSMTYAGVSTAYSYNLDNQLMQSGDFTLTRDINNSLVRELTDGTLTQKRVYNGYGELTRQDDGVLVYQLQRDETKIIRKTEFVTKYVEAGNTDKPNKGKGKAKPTKLKKVKVKVTYDYHFDKRDRLTEVYKDRELVEQYTYDANGNRASATVNNIATAASYTLDDQLVVYGDNTYLYNDDGYLVEKVTPEGTTTYEYGTLGELREVVTPTKTITYEHNANNQRVAKKVNGTIVEKYLWKNLTTLLAVYDGSDNLVQRFEYADQRMPVAMTQNNQKYYLHYDQVGSLRAVSDSSSNIIKEITYDTYGNILSDSNENFKVPFGFAGGLYDPDTKLTRFGYRDYDAYTGKWTAKDPIGFDGGDTNLYGYVLGDPVNFVDPTGKVWQYMLAGGLTGLVTSYYNPCTHKFNRSTPIEDVLVNGALGAVGGLFVGIGALVTTFTGGAIATGIALGGEGLVQTANYFNYTLMQCECQ
ncbi:MAG TPA: RHS repeat-associated core domain-containing protein [Sulfurovum sp.]